MPEIIILHCEAVLARRLLSCRCSLVGHGLNDSSGVALVKRIQDLHILCLELEVEDVGIRSNAVWVIRLGERHPLLLQRVTNQDLLG